MEPEKDEKRSTISVSSRTKNVLATMKHDGQSYDRLLKELIRFWQRKRSEYWTQRQIQKRKGKGSIFH